MRRPVELVGRLKVGVGMFDAYDIDQTPWVGLARHAGRFVVSLYDAHNIVAALQRERMSTS